MSYKEILYFEHLKAAKNHYEKVHLLIVVFSSFTLRTFFDANIPLYFLPQGAIPLI